MERYGIFWLILFFSLVGCAGSHPEGDNDFARPQKSGGQIRGSDSEDANKMEPETPPIVPLNPRIFEIEFHVFISNIHVYRGEQLRKDNLSKGIPAVAPPQLYVWSAGIVQRKNQIVLDLGLEGPSPSEIYRDFENGNPIYFWNLSSLLGKEDPIAIVRRVKVQCYELLSLVDTSTSLAYDFSDRQYRFYTKSEPFIELTSRVKEVGVRIAGQEPNPFKKAKLLFEWVNQNMSYQYPPPGRGAASALASLKGDRGQYSFLFIALCRAVGIPARFVAGFQADEAGKMRYHTWAEFFLPQHGWLPADPASGVTRFGRLSNDRLIASLGTNIRLRHAPFWATFANSEVEQSRTPFMQVATIVSSGIQATIKTGISTLKSGATDSTALSRIQQ